MLHTPPQRTSLSCLGSCWFAHVGRCAAEQHVARGGVPSGKVASLAVQDDVRSSSAWPASFMAKLLHLCTGSPRQNVHRIRHSTLP